MLLPIGKTREGRRGPPPPKGGEGREEGGTTVPGKVCGILLSLAGSSWSLGRSVGVEVVECVVCMTFLE